MWTWSRATTRVTMVAMMASVVSVTLWGRGVRNFAPVVEKNPKKPEKVPEAGGCMNKGRLLGKLSPGGAGGLPRSGLGRGTLTPGSRPIGPGHGCHLLRAACNYW